MTRGCSILTLVLALPLVGAISLAAQPRREAEPAPDQYTISTIAGNGRRAFSGAGGSALNAQLVSPQFDAIDASGNIYVSDSYFNQVFQIKLNGQISVFAGSGVPGNSGDGGPAASAALNQPMGLAFDSHGNLYIADSFNWTIRKVTPSGVITALAGNGSPGFGGNGGAATAASIEDPVGLAVDSSDNLYITQPSNNVIRRVSSSGIISLFAGTGDLGYTGDGHAATAADLSGPGGIAVDASGAVFFSDQGSRIRRVGTDGTITTFAGSNNSAQGDGLPAVSASLTFPGGLAATSDGSLYVADSGNFRVRVIARDGTISTVAGGGSLTSNGPATQADLPYPIGLATDSLGRIVIVTQIGRQVRRWSADGSIVTMAGVYPSANQQDDVPAISESLLSAFGVAADSEGNVFVSDPTDNRILKIAPDETISTFAGDSLFGSPADGSKAATLGSPLGLAFDQDGNLLAGSGSSETVFRLAPDGTSTRVAGGNGPANSGDFGSALLAAIGTPVGVVAAPGGGFYIADSTNHVVRKVSAGGEITTYAGAGKPGYTGDNGPASAAMLDGPQQLAVDTDGSLYIADTNNNVIRKVSPSGVITTVAGNGLTGGSLGDGGAAAAAELIGPFGVAIDSEVAVLFIAEGNRIRRVDLSTGLIRTIAGSRYGANGFAGDGGPALNALLWGPTNLAVDQNHNVYLADGGNFRVRKLTPVRRKMEVPGPQPADR